MEGWQPTIVVGIDFGMTCTAVSWSTAPEWAEPKCIQRWPGRFHNSELKNKVATQVSYDEHDRVVSWGFTCDWDDVPTTIMKEFKLYLDPSFPDTFPNRPTHPQAVQWYRDYMKSLWQYLDAFFRDTIPDWKQRNVEYLFSIPTTWLSPSLSAQLKSWLEEAGFVGAYNRRIEISQTEAEAAAVYAAKQSYQVGDKIMVADAGGATTDVNILEIIEHTRDRARLKALDKAEGINVGSTLIDERVRQLIRDRLRALNVLCDNDEVQWTAEDMMKRCNFEAIKCSFDGAQVQMDTHLAVPDEILPPSLRNRRQQVVVTAEELRRTFDEQLKVMFQTINMKLLDFTNQRPHDSVKYLVLSGGLGSSKYIQRRMKAQYANMEVLCAPEPQLAVAKGLVMDRVQALSTGKSVYTGKCSRVSYGVLTRLPYDPVLHRGEYVKEDPLDKMKWVDNQIDWLVKEGEPVPDKGFTRGYRLKIAKGEENECVEARFVMSDLPASTLPKSLRTSDDVSQICSIRAHFREDEFGSSGRHGKFSNPQIFQLKKGGILHLTRGKDHYVAEFNLRVIVGSADLKFELESKDGRKYDQNDASIKVQWHDAPAKPKAKLKKNKRTMYPAAARDK